MYADGYQDIAVFWDWGSLFQECRSEEEFIKFKTSLKNVNYWYAHKKTLKILLTCLPPGSECRAYHARGWPTFEESVGSMITDGKYVVDISAPLDSTGTFEAVQDLGSKGRKPPLSPDEFNVLVKSKHFTNGADLDNVVLPKYEQTFREVISDAERLDYMGLSWGDAEATTLAAAVPFCQNLKMIHLYNNDIGDDGVGQLAAAFPKCPKLELIELGGNNIHDKGTQQLALALPKCASLSHIKLWKNHIGDAGGMALAAAFAECACLVEVILPYNNIGDAGATAFAPVFPKCKSLRDFQIFGNPISKEVKDLLQEAWNKAGKASNLFP
jgi:hypothetical protein